MDKRKHKKPAYIAMLEASYGPPSQAGFGSAVFYEPLTAAGDLEKQAVGKYRYFVGDLWERFGEEAWMSVWKEVYTRPAGAHQDIASELRNIADFDAQLSIPMILDNIENPLAAQQALSAAFDEPSVDDLRVYTTGDGEAMSGVLVAARRSSGEAYYVLFLLD